MFIFDKLNMVNTFLLCPDFAISATWLDNKRLWKQILEATQIVDVLTNGGKSWRNHPATLMWEGYLPSLQFYINAHIDEWARRGKNNNSRAKYQIREPIIYPWWMYSPIIYYSYRANLLRKDPQHYAGLLEFTPVEYHNRGYFWPSKILSKFGQEAICNLSSLPLEEILAPVQSYSICSGYYKNGKKCMARASKFINEKAYCRRHTKN